MNTEYVIQKTRRVGSAQVLIISRHSWTDAHPLCRFLVTPYLLRFLYKSSTKYTKHGHSERDALCGTPRQGTVRHIKYTVLTPPQLRL